MTIYSFIALAICILVFGYLLHQVRRRRIRGKYVILWLALDLLIAFASVFPKATASVAHGLGFEVTSNMLLVSACAVLFGVSIHLSVMVSRFEEDIRTLTEECAFLRQDVTVLADRLAAEEGLASGADEE